MGINAKQAEFTRCMGEFLCWCFASDLPMIGAEWYRTPEQAALNEENGSGIANSVHTKKMAFDMFRLVNGTVSWDIEDYRKAGEKWKTMHPDARWGGDFKSKDAVHFSFEHDGVM